MTQNQTPNISISPPTHTHSTTHSIAQHGTVSTLQPLHFTSPKHTALMAAAENISRSKEVSTMIKHGFLSDPSLSSYSPSRLTSTSRVSPSPSPSNPSPPPSFAEKVRSSPTLFDMMSEEQQRESRHFDDKRRKSQERVSRILEGAPFQDPVWGGEGDVKLSVSSRDGLKISMDVHRRVLADRSGFFREKLGDERVSHSVEICDCDDVEVYVETVVLMYCDDLMKRLVKEEVGKVLGILKVSAAIQFDAGILSCLEYLEAVPWSEDEEKKVVSIIGQLQLNDSAVEVLQRVSTETSTSASSDDIFLELLSGVLQAKDDKARREMKTLISGLFKEDTTKKSNHSNVFDVSRETLYDLCNKCLGSLVLCLTEAENVDDSNRDRGGLMGEISREADNLQWIVDIMIQKKYGDEFVKLWADQKELANVHKKIPSMYRYEISRVTAQLCTAIGRGQVLVSRDARHALLCTWLEALYEDFGWMRRACRSFDKKLVEDGLSQTILTLSLAQQQDILLNWFSRFLSKGDDCPNIQRAFEVWWRRAFVRQYASEQDQSHLQIAVCDYPT